jgi:23S rRNA pseudouridine1911/1915/1917 synthase
VVKGESLTGVAGRLDQVVAAAMGVPRADVQRAIAAGRILVDGRPRSKAFRLQGGERIDVETVNEVDLEGEGPPVPVRYEDGSLLVVAKPAGVVTHPTASRRTGTLVNRLLGMGVPLAQAGAPFRPGIVHRLDAGTSGLLIVAKTDEAYAALQGMLRRHEVARAYLALVRGAPAHDAFAVDAPVGRRAARVVVDLEEGRPASTSFEVLERLPAATLLRAVPRTGRTHQIRVHLSAIGHPILGDRIYGGIGDDTRALGLGRPFLHAARLTFVHPFTAVEVDLEEPLPEDLALALERARRDLGA